MSQPFFMLEDEDHNCCKLEGNYTTVRKKFGDCFIFIYLCINK